MRLPIPPLGHLAGVAGFEPAVCRDQSPVPSAAWRHPPVLAHAMGFEPTISGSTIRRLRPLGYTCMTGWSGGNRTHVCAVKSRVPVALSATLQQCGCSGWDRTSDVRLIKTVLYRLSYRAIVVWYPLTGLNRRPWSCKDPALPTELRGFWRRKRDSNPRAAIRSHHVSNERR